MAEINSGNTIINRLLRATFDLEAGASFVISSGWWDTAVPPVWHELKSETIGVQIQDVAPVMLSAATVGLTRREDMLRAWSQLFLDKGWFTGTITLG
jgi:hypothetical protein